MPSQLPTEGSVILDCRYQLWLVGLSYLVAVAASYSALDIARHATQMTLQSRRLFWLATGAFCLGGGIWSMHFIAMLAFQAPIAIHYDVTTTVASLALAIVVSTLAMWVIGRGQLRFGLYLSAAVIVGFGIASMHYLGMASVRSVASAYYDPSLFGLSILIAVVASLVALLLAFYFQDKQGRMVERLKLLAALVMGFAMVAMHFTGMAAYSLVVPPNTPLQLQQASADSWLGLAVAAVGLTVIATGSFGAWLERRQLDTDATLRRLSSQLSELTYYDGLTNLFNKQALADIFETLVRRDSKPSCIALLYIDLDNFKRINDSYGFALADRVIALAAERIRNASLANDIVGRFTGDEFCVLSCVDAPADALRIGERIINRMQRPFSIDGSDFQLTVSVGVSVWPSQSTDFEQLVRQATMAMNEAKRKGPAEVQLFAAELEQEAQQTLEIERELRQAIHNDSLQVYYQPIVGPDGNVLKLEALLRWQHPRLGFVSPERFIGIAERNGMITDLDLWVLKRACADLHHLHQRGFDWLQVSVNCSPINLSIPKLPELVREILEHADLAPRFLILEVTENALMANLSTASATLNRIRELGVGVSVDDFGSGYSSLAYLSKLPLDTLKVDRMFVRDIPENHGDMAITGAIIAMAHKLNLRVVAEGVETMAQLDFLRSNGCEYLQGYYFSKALPMAELERFLRGERPLAANDIGAAR